MAAVSRVLELGSCAIPVGRLDVGGEVSELGQGSGAEVVGEVHGDGVSSWATDGAELSLGDGSRRLHLNVEQLVADGLSGASSIHEIVVVATSVGDLRSRVAPLKVESIAHSLDAHGVLVGAASEALTVLDEVDVRLPGTGCSEESSDENLLHIK